MAAPNPERELERLRRHLAKGPGAVTVITGASGFFRQEAVELALAAVPEGRDLRRIDGQDDGDGRELDDLRGGGLFGGGTWLCVRRGDKWLQRHGDGLLLALDAVAPGCGLVLEVGRLDKRTRLGKALAARDLFEFRDLYAEPFDRTRSPLEAELCGWLVQRARPRGLTLKPEAAYLLIGTIGKDPAELLAEVDRLRQQGLAGRVGPEQLRGRLHAGFESTPFELAEALLDGDRRRALRAVDAMFARGVRARDGATMDRGGVFPFVASWLFQALRSAHRGRQLLEQGTPLREVAAAAGVRVFADRFQRQVARNDEPRLRRGLRRLVDCQRQLRLSGEDPRWLVEQLVHAWFADGGWR